MQDQDTPRSTAELTAWAAGLFEGEGTAAARVQDGGKVGVQIRLGSTDPDVIDTFRSVVGGGNIYVQKGRKDHHKTLYTWCVYEAAFAVEILERLLPWLHERRAAKVREVLELARTVATHVGKRTHCPQGHPYEGENLIHEWVGAGENRHLARRCKTCRRIQGREKMRRRLGITPERYRVTD